MVLEVRTSERTMFKRCPQKWWWGYVEGLKPIREANPLWFGGAVHDGLAEWYQKGSKRGPHPTETFLQSLEGDRAVLAYDEETEAEYVDARELGADMLNRYVDHFGKDEQWDVIATEQTFQSLLAHPITGAKRWLRYVGTFDGVYRDLDTGEILLMEHKTAASIRTGHLPLDDQAGAYWAFATTILRKQGLIGPGEKISGIMYNFLRKALNDKRPMDERGRYRNQPIKKHYIEAINNHIRGNDNRVAYDKMSMETLKTKADELGLTVYGDVSKVQPPPYFERIPVYRSIGQRKTQLRRIQDEALHMEAMKKGDMPVYKVVTQFGGMPCERCEFFRLCQMDEQGSEFFQDFKESEFKTWDPYADHHNERKSAEG